MGFDLYGIKPHNPDNLVKPEIDYDNWKTLSDIIMQFQVNILETIAGGGDHYGIIFVSLLVNYSLIKIKNMVIQMIFMLFQVKKQIILVLNC